MLPHTNLGVLSKEDLARLREVTASQGLMLESVDERLMETVHAGSPDQAPEGTPGDARSRRRAEDPLHDRDPRRHRREPRVPGRIAGSDRGGPREVRPHPGDHPPELRSAPALLRRRGGGDRQPGFEGALERRRAGGRRGAAARVGEPGRPRRDQAAYSGNQAADAGRRRPGPAEPQRLVAGAGRAGATDLGGLSANGDHISPEEPFPSPHQVRKELAPRGYALTERLCVYPQYMDMDWMEQGVLDVIKLKYWSFIPRSGSGVAVKRSSSRDPPRGRSRRGARGSSSPRTS